MYRNPRTARSLRKRSVPTNRVSSIAVKWDLRCIILGSTITSTRTRSHSESCLMPSMLVRSEKPTMKRSDRCITSPPSIVAGGSALLHSRYSSRARPTSDTSARLLTGRGLVKRARPPCTTAVSSTKQASGSVGSGSSSITSTPRSRRVFTYRSCCSLATSMFTVSRSGCVDMHRRNAVEGGLTRARF